MELKVLHVTPSFAPAWLHGGPAVSVYELCRRLPGFGIEVRVLTTDANGPYKTLEIESGATVELHKGLKVQYCKRRRWGLFPPNRFFSPALIRQLPRQILWSDVVHITEVYAVPCIAAVAMAAVLRKPVVWSPRGSLQRWQGTSRKLSKKVWERAWKLVCDDVVLHVTSKQELLESQERFSNMTPVLIPNGVEVPQCLAPTPIEEKLNLLYIGRLDPKKGIENLIEACRQLTQRTEHLEWSLVVAGTGPPGYTNKLEELVRQNHLSQQVSFVGHVEGENKKRVLEEASLTVIPSFMENFAIVVAESLAHGTAVVASDATPWSRVEEIGCGLWVDNSPESLASAIIMASELDLVDMGQRGREWMKEEFSWDDRAKQLSEVYKAIYERRLSN